MHVNAAPRFVARHDYLARIVSLDGHGWAKTTIAQRSAHGQNPVADGFRVESLYGPFPVEPVVRIQGQFFRRSDGSLAVAGRCHNRLVQLLETPTVLHQLGGQPVEQFGVRRTLPECSEVVGRVHDAAAEVMQPDAIGDHTGDQRMFAIGQPTGIGQSTARSRQRPIVVLQFEPRCRNRRDLQPGGTHHIGRLLEIAPMEDVRVGCLARNLGQHAQEFLHWFPLADLRDSLVELLQVVGVRLVVLVQRTGRDVDTRVFLQQPLLLIGSLAAGRLVCHVQLFPQRLVVLRQFLGQGCFEIHGLLGRFLGDQLPGLGFHVGGNPPILVGVQRHATLLWRPPAFPIHGGRQNRPQPIIVFLRDRIVAMIVALGTTNAESQ